MLGYAPLKATSGEAVLCIHKGTALELHEQVMSINGCTNNVWLAVRRAGGDSTVAPQRNQSEGRLATHAAPKVTT